MSFCSTKLVAFRVSTRRFYQAEASAKDAAEEAMCPAELTVTSSVKQTNLVDYSDIEDYFI